MKKQSKPIISIICIVLGICLLFSGMLTLILWQYNINSSTEKSRKYVDTIRELIPQPQGAVPEQRSNNTMPVLAVDGTDFVGILEIPRYQSTLPVGADWGSTRNYPCRSDGSIYDNTMQIGATSQKGQYDFYRELSAGDTVIFTDMEGNSYTYRITDLSYEKHADKTALSREDTALTLFIKNVYAFEYLIVSCDLLK